MTEMTARTRVAVLVRATKRASKLFWKGWVLPLARKGRMQASIDRVALGSILGWAFDPAFKGPVTIELRTEGGELLMQSLADQPRPDVGRQLGTHGFHGFVIPRPLGQSTKQPIQVFACSGSSRTLLTVLRLDDDPEYQDPANVEHRDSMIVVRPSQLTRVLGTETLVICGPGRGGTSIVAYVLRNLDYYLGDKLRVNTHEDQDVQTAMGNPSEMERIIADRNRRFKRWGFKFPSSVQHIEWLAGALRNPVFLVVFRNPVATAKSALKRDPQVVGADLRGLARALENGLRNMDIGTQVLTTKAPSLLIDVDAARGTPERLVRDLADLFAPNTSGQRIEAIARDITAAGYKPLSSAAKRN